MGSSHRTVTKQNAFSLFTDTLAMHKIWTDKLYSNSDFLHHIYAQQCSVYAAKTTVMAL
jgi:hypothetical protein